MIEGGDISNYQGTDIDWQTVARNWSFAWVLITDGLHFVNPDAPAQVSQLLDAGVRVGGYHFARPTAGDPGAQADYFAAHCPPGLDLAPMLDSETSWLGDVDANTLWITGWFDHLSPAVRVWYTNRDGVNRHVRSVDLARAGVRLFLAAPGQADMAGAGAWGQADVVQYGVAPVDGFPAPVDRDRMTEDTFRLLTGDSEVLDPNDPIVHQLTQGISDLETVVQHADNALNDPNGGVQVKLDQLRAEVDALKAAGGTVGGVDADAIAAAVVAKLGQAIRNG